MWATFTYSQVVISLKIECIQNRGLSQVEKLFVSKGTEAPSIKVLYLRAHAGTCMLNKLGFYQKLEKELGLFLGEVVKTRPSALQTQYVDFLIHSF